MPKETIKTTEVVEKENTETIYVCDGCGMEGEDSEIYKFKSHNFPQDLYFCRDCLGMEAKTPINDHFIENIPAVTHDSSEGAALYSGIFSMLIGYSVLMLLMGPLPGIFFGTIVGFGYVILSFMITGFLIDGINSRS